MIEAVKTDPALDDTSLTGAEAPPRPAPATRPAFRVEVPESPRYRLKKRLLGPPLYTEDLAHERLGNPTALAVFASDNLSSSAYATEEILRILIPAIGVAAFSLVVPITTAPVAIATRGQMCRMSRHSVAR